jgi:hypothetical protein
MALADAHRAFAVQAAMRGATAVPPAELANIRSCDEDGTGDAPFLKVGKAMRDALRALGAPSVRWDDHTINATGESALRCVAAKAVLRQGPGVCALYGDEAGASEDAQMTFTVVACDVEVTPGGTDTGEPEYDLPVPGPLRATLLALAISVQALAAETGENGDGTAAIAVPASATLPAAMRAGLASTRATDAGRVLHFLEEAGLGPDAAEFLAACGA